MSGASLLAAHTGFVLGVEPDMLPALLCGKLCGALAAVILSVKFYGENSPSGS